MISLEPSLSIASLLHNFLLLAGGWDFTKSHFVLFLLPMSNLVLLGLSSHSASGLFVGIMLTISIGLVLRFLLGRLEGEIEREKLGKGLGLP